MCFYLHFYRHIRALPLIQPNHSRLEKYKVRSTEMFVDKIVELCFRGVALTCVAPTVLHLFSFAFLQTYRGSAPNTTESFTFCKYKRYVAPTCL